MARKKSVFILPKLKDCGGDLTKKWYVEYSLRDPQTGEMKRFRHYEGFAELATESARRAHAEKVISTIKNKLNSGEDPFAENHVTYQDELMYQAMVNRWGNDSRGCRQYQSAHFRIPPTEKSRTCAFLLSDLLFQTEDLL